MAKYKPTDALRILNTDYRSPEAPPVKYQILFNKIASAEIPARRDDNGSRWLIDEADLPAISIALGLTPAAPMMFEQVPPKPATDKRRPKALVAKDEIEPRLLPCGPAAAPVEMAPPKRRERPPLKPRKAASGK